MIIKTLGDLRKALQTVYGVPDSCEVAIDDGEEFKDFEFKQEEFGISLKAI